MHSWHPLVVHLPLVGLVVAVAFDLAAARNRSARWRDAATVLWWVGLLGAAVAVTTGLLAYNRVEHSDPAHEAMTLHRNLALAAVTVLQVTALWRWRRAHSGGAALLGRRAQSPLSIASNQPAVGAALMSLSTVVVAITA